MTTLPETPNDPVELPLSYSQQLMRFLEHLHPGEALSEGFYVSSRYRLRGDLDLEVLQRGFDFVVQRHDALRSVVVVERGIAFQRVWPEARARVRIADALPEDLTPDQRDERIAAFFADCERGRGDDATVPAIWTSVLRVAPQEHLLSIVVPHIVSDLWSLDLIMDDWAAYCRAERDGAPMPSSMPLQHSDFVRREQGRDAADLERRIDYWARTLEGVNDCGIPIRRTAPDETGARAVHRCALGTELTAGLQQFARRKRSPLFVSLVTAYAVALACVTGLDDIPVISLSIGRDDPALRGLVSFVANVMMLRGRFVQSMSLEAAHQEMRTVYLGALEHEAPAAVLADAVPDTALMMASDNYSVMPFEFVPEPTEATGRDFGGSCSCELVVDDLFDEQSTSHLLPLDALAMVFATGDDLVLEVEYATNLFGSDVIAGFSNVFRRVAQLLVDAPESTIEDVARSVGPAIRRS